MVSFYLFSTYPMGTRRSWNDNVARDPHVRIKIGDQEYAIVPCRWSAIRLKSQLRSKPGRKNTPGREFPRIGRFTYITSSGELYFCNRSRTSHHKHGATRFQCGSGIVLIGRFFWRDNGMRVRSTGHVCFSRKAPKPENSKPYAMCGCPVVGCIAAATDTSGVHRWIGGSRHPARNRAGREHELARGARAGWPLRCLICDVQNIVLVEEYLGGRWQPGRIDELAGPTERPESSPGRGQVTWRYSHAHLRRPSVEERDVGNSVRIDDQ